MTKETSGPIAFVLATYQVGRVHALLELGVRPDLVVGTSLGAIQAALLAAEPTADGTARMREFRREAARRRVLRTGPVGALRSLRTGQFARGSAEPLRRLLGEFLGADSRFEEMAVPLQICAASIERATARYFARGPLIPALMASCAIPGLFPAYRIGDEHYVDGGVVEAAAISRAVDLGARTVLVVRQRRERALKPPRWPWQIGRTSYEISRRRHLAGELGRPPEGVGVHLVDAAFLGRLGQSPVTAAREISAYLGGKFDRFFDLCDRNRDEAVAETDLLALGARIAEATGARSGSLGHQRLEEAFAGFWLRLRSAAGLEEIEAKSLRREDFRHALARITADRPAYDEQVAPLIGSLLAAADENGDEVLSPAEISTLLRALGVAEADADRFVLLLDVYNNGELSLEELGEAFRQYFTAEEPGPVGNAILGGAPVG
ncbi:MAG TPA: patatin-like phospholipase family protein [Actinospica sp.]|nr:patatin-like phospholipase family protein [Actinospica sp.]